MAYMRPLFFGIVAFLILGNAFADFDAESVVKFALSVSDGVNPDFRSVVLLQCQTGDCSDAEILRDSGPQGFSCDSGLCRATSDAFSPFSVLDVVMTDGRKLRSNIFMISKPNSAYEVLVGDSYVVVTEISASDSRFIEWEKREVAKEPAS